MSLSGEKDCGCHESWLSVFYGLWGFIEVPFWGKKNAQVYSLEHILYLYKLIPKIPHTLICTQYAKCPAGNNQIVHKYESEERK